MVKFVRGIEDGAPGGEYDVGGQHEDMGEEAVSLVGGLSRGLPGWLSSPSTGVPGEGEQIEGR